MNKIRIVILLYFIALIPAFAQVNNSLLPLKEILAAIEKQHGVKFNYLDDDIADYKIEPPNKTLALHEKMAYLRQNTALAFDFIDNRSISISVKNGDDPPTDPLLSQELSEVFVPNYIAKGISKKKDGSYVVMPKKFGILPGLTEADVLQTMQQLPGILSVDETISNINVRGGTHDQNHFSWNGIRMFQTGHFFGLISAFNSTLSQEIKIYKNGTSAFYGESVSSTVDISTKSATIENTSLGFGSNLINAEFFATVKVSDNESFTVSGRRSFTDWLESPTYKSYSRRVFQNTIVTNLNNNQDVDYGNEEDFYFYDFTFQYRQKTGDKSELTADMIAISNSLDIEQSKTESGGTATKSSGLKQQNYGGNISWKTNWDKQNSTKANIYASYYNLDSTTDALENIQTFDQQNTVLDVGIRIENTHILSKRMTFSNGYQFNETGISNNEDVIVPEFSREITRVSRSHALIAEGEYNSANKKVFLRTGVRLNYFEKFNLFLIEPRIQFNYALSRNLHLEVLGEMKSQTASQVIDLQQDFLGLEKRRWNLADETENPVQKSRQISLGLNYRSNGWLLTLDNFYKKVSGISSSSQSFQNQLEFRRLNGYYDVIGSEVLVQKNFRKFYTWLSYSVNNNQYTFSGYHPATFDNNFEIVQTVSWAGIYEWKRLKLAIGSKWYSGKPETTPRSNNLIGNNPSNPQIDYNEPNNTTLADYFQVNFSAFYKWQPNPKTTVQFGASVLNLLNKKNIINRYYRVNIPNNSIESVNTYSLERTPNLSVKINF